MVIVERVIVTLENFEWSTALRLRSHHIVAETRVHALHRRGCRWTCRARRNHLARFVGSGAGRNWLWGHRVCIERNTEEIELALCASYPLSLATLSTRHTYVILSYEHSSTSLATCSTTFIQRKKARWIHVARCSRSGETGEELRLPASSIGHPIPKPSPIPRCRLHDMLCWRSTPTTSRPANRSSGGRQGTRLACRSPTMSAMRPCAMSMRRA